MRWKPSWPAKDLLPSVVAPRIPRPKEKTSAATTTLLKYLRVHQPSTLDEAALRIEMFRKHYNTKRPHQGLPGHVTPFQAWEMIDHAPATEPLDPSVLAQRVQRYRASEKKPKPISTANLTPDWLRPVR